MDDIFVSDSDFLDAEEFIEIPDTGIHDFTRPILYTALDEPSEIINIDAGNLRVDSAANIVGNVSSGSRSLPKNFLGISAHSFTGERSAISDSLGGIEDYTNVGSFTTSVYNPLEPTHIGFGTYGGFGNALATNANGSLLIIGNKTSIIDGYFVGIGTTVGIATYYGSVYLYERISNNFIKRDCIVGEYSKASIGAIHGVGIASTSNDDYGYSVAMSLDGKTFAVGGPNVIEETRIVGATSTSAGFSTALRTGVVWVYDYKPPVDSEFCGIGSLTTCCGIGTSTFCEVLGSNLLETSSLSSCGIGSTNICKSTENVDKLIVLRGDGDGDLFGQSIAISADAKLLVVGAPGAGCTIPNYNSGAVYVYDRNDNTYDKVGILTSPSSGTFGSSVSVNGDGNIIVVGDSSSSKSYVYERDEKVYGYFRKIGTLTNGGTQVCVSDDGATVIVSNGTNSTVYDRSGNTFTSIGTLTGGAVGISCSPDGKVITTANTNAYYVYNREGDTFYLNATELSTLNSFDMSANTKVIYRGNSAEVVGSGKIGKVYCDDQSLETFVYTDASGNVGVGTSQPSTRLHVSGNTRIDGNTTINGNANISGIVTGAIFYGDGSGLYNIGGISGINTASTSTFSNLIVTGVSTFPKDIYVNNLTVGKGKNEISDNTVLGISGLSSVTTGFRNVSIGYLSLRLLTEGVRNVSVGAQSLELLTTGDNNIAIGEWALHELKTANYNTAVGGESLYFATSSSNTAVGFESLYVTGIGASNTAIGHQAGAYNGTDYNSGNITGNNNSFIGYRAINVAGGESASNTIVLGNSSITTLRCNAGSISALSDARDKKDVENIDLGLDFIRDLRPVKFKWNQRDGGKVDLPDSGFIAQEALEVVNKYNAKWFGLVDDQNPNHFEMSNTKLIPVFTKAIQEQQEIIESQNKMITELKNELTTLKERIDTAGIA